MASQLDIGKYLVKLGNGKPFGSVFQQELSSVRYWFMKNSMLVSGLVIKMSTN